MIDDKDLWSRGWGWLMVDMGPKGRSPEYQWMQSGLQQPLGERIPCHLGLSRQS
jgi:hypothetical protein